MSLVSLVILMLYFAILIAIGLAFARKQTTLSDFFLAGHAVPAWAALAAVVAAETSAVTFIGAPAQTFQEGGDLSFLQVALGFLIARVVLAVFFLPKFMSQEILTIYAYLGKRFGTRTQKMAGLFFFITRALASGVRHYAASLVISSVFQFDLAAAIVITGVVSLAYSATGGLKAVIWTEVLQLGVMILGGILGAYYAWQLIPGGWETILETGARHAKFAVIHWDWTGGGNYSFFMGLLGGTCLGLATHGADQDIVQRLLACQSLPGARKALVGSGIFVLFQFAFFLLLGIMLFTYYGTLPPGLEKTDEIFPYFAAQRMPPVAAGLVIAAILSAALSSTAASLNSLASSTMSDFVLVIWKPVLTPRRQVLLSRAITVFWMGVLVGIAMWASGSKNILDTGLSIPSYTYGSLLAAFLLGIFTRFRNEYTLMAGMLAGAGAVWAISRCQFHWTWFVPVGALVSMATAIAGEMVWERWKKPTE
ncbi:MAG: sodium/solute symporter [Candidatus Omnitrophica bacterium]|nr:sodium/solute symporter [Candidatus Omnitrophota bacterium]